MNALALSLMIGAALPVPRLETVEPTWLLMVWMPDGDPQVMESFTREVDCLQFAVFLTNHAPSIILECVEK